MKNTIFIACLFGSLFCGSCKKGNAPTESGSLSISPTEEIIGKWNFVKMGSSRPVGSEEVFTTMPTGSYYDFQSNSTLYKKSTSTTQTRWSLINNGSTLKFDDQLNVNFIVSTLNSTQLIFYADTEDLNHVTTRTVYYFTR